MPFYAFDDRILEKMWIKKGLLHNAYPRIFDLSPEPHCSYVLKYCYNGESNAKRNGADQMFFRDT